jgi:peptidoglycan/xylan/chitin deacetylase (PgdA/CDA1 family)
MNRRAIVCHGAREVPAVALTFDAGRGSVTPVVLGVLRDRGARATFNVLGSRVRAGVTACQIVALDSRASGVAGVRGKTPGSSTSCR